MNEHVKAEKGEEEEMCKFSLLKKKERRRSTLFECEKRRKGDQVSL